MLGLDLQFEFSPRNQCSLRQIGDDGFDFGNGSFGGGVDTQDGGGTPGTPTGGGTAQTALPANENGGVVGSTYFLFVPVKDIRTGVCYIASYDVSSFDDAIDGSSYSYRSEDIIKHKTPTVNQVILIYRDLGLAKLTVTLKGSNDDGQVISASVSVQIGNAKATGALLTKRVYLSLTGYRPQLTLSRSAGDGPICITSATMAGEVEEQ